ncbi:MAG: hypothetical protein IIY49_05345 [Eubacterium sp.]|nr:hypothetical protein [Eubacterium sp.]
MKARIILLVTACFAVAAYATWPKRTAGSIERAENYEAIIQDFDEMSYKRTLNGAINVVCSGVNISNYKYKFRMTERMELLFPDDFMEDVMGCSIIKYDDENIVVLRRDTRIELKVGSNVVKINGIETEVGPAIEITDSGRIYIPMDKLSNVLGFDVSYNYELNCITVDNRDNNDNLPDRYDMRDDNRVTPVRDQGFYGTCWAFASLGALETSLMPYEENIYSVDHMTHNNSYNLDINAGGEHTMSIAYLASWQGPVYEKDDVYGDEETDENLKAVKHLEEAIIINERNDVTLKNAVFKYGGIETSLYLEMDYYGHYSKYFDDDNNSYYYDGEEKPNHDVVIVGWDDNFSKDNFSIKPQRDGAFICKNSWGEGFGEDGYFYVSYDDVNIGNQAIVYTKLSDSNNFDNIYQADMLGWVGQLGFGKKYAYFANCYTAKKDEELAAVSFYATGNDARFSVYYVPDFENVESFRNREYLVSGGAKYSGYYTVRLPEKKKLKKGEKYAVVVYINTAEDDKPIAIEYNADEKTDKFDMEDGEGYISLYGEIWNRAEDRGCNVCLKAFTDDIKEGD